MNESTGIFITVRLGSTRLPKKALEKVNGKYIIEYLIERIKFINSGVSIFICTTDLSEDYFLDDIAKAMKVNIYHGSSENVLLRHLNCAKNNNIDFIVSIDGDDILCFPELINRVIQNNDGGYDIIKTVGYPLGTNVMGYKTIVLANILKNVKSNIIDTGWGELFDNEAYKTLKINASAEDICDVRLTLDYKEDLELFTKIIKDLKMDITFAPQGKIINYFKMNPEVKDLNSAMNAEYYDNFNSKKVRRYE